MRDKRHDILFDPIRLGPVLSKNRFYQVPHCTGMGWQRPNTLAAMRGVKAEGGWGVVCTEYCSVHPTSDDASYPFTKLWNDDDIKSHALVTDNIHKHNALAGVELWLGGNFVANFDTRLPPMGLLSRPLTNLDVYHPIQSRKIDKSDIFDLLNWQKLAAKRAVEAGFDIVYVYAAHGYLLSDFLNSETNNRSDEYGGSLKNRVRIVKELIEVTKDAVKDNCAVATRFSVDLSDPESYDAFSLLSELPDLWDLTIHDYNIEMGASRFVKENALEKNILRAKTSTTKPIVAVGRFTSPDTMARVIKNNIQDMIGAARPSISDPFLPKKIESGSYEDIRECIGCNICYANDSIGVPIRCTQNPTMGEEWRRNWHPENIKKLNIRETVLVVGAGPSGLEASRVLGKRGYNVLLTEEANMTGGRVSLESKLPGLSEWIRVKDWRDSQIKKLPNVEVFLGSKMNSQDIIDVNADHVLIATGSKWTIDGIGRHNNKFIERAINAIIISPEIVLMQKAIPSGKVTIFDDDHYYMGPVMALYLRSLNYNVTLITTAGRVGQWGEFTEEIYDSNAALINAGVNLITNKNLKKVNNDNIEISCIFSGNIETIDCNWIIPLTRREPNDHLFYDLQKIFQNTNSQKIKTVLRIGDCEAPGIIANAVYSGYKAGIELGGNLIKEPTYKDL